MSTPTPLPAELEALVLAVLETRVKEHKAAARAAIERLYDDGDKRVIRSPLDDTKLGAVWRTSPDPAWRVVDREALAAHLAEDPRNLEYVDEIVGTDDQVLEVLQAHAPHLLARVERVPDSLFRALLTASVAQGSAAAPGIARVKPRGTLTVRPDKDAGAAVERLVAAGVITWDGTPAALPASSPAQRSPYDMTLPEALAVAGSSSECSEEDVLGALSVLAQAYRDTRVIADDAERRAAGAVQE